MDKDKKFISFPIDTDHIEHWGQFWEPVILTVWDAKSNITYWESIQKYLEEQAGNESKRKSIRVAIPTRNVLDNDGVKRIARYTKSRYILNEQEHEGIDTLIELLEEALKAKIEYYPKRGIIFIDYVNGRATHTFFGSNNPLLDLIEQHPEEHYQKMLLKTVNELAKIKQELKETGKITLQDENGIIVETYETFEDYIQHITENNDKKIYGFE